MQGLLTLNLDAVHLTDEQFYQLCQNNRELQFERTAKGELIILPSVGGESGNRESELIADLVLWNRQKRLGYTFSSSTIFKLPKGGDRSPDAAWIRRERWEALTPEQRRKFPPIAPDFVMELRSATDDLEVLQVRNKLSGNAKINQYGFHQIKAYPHHNVMWFNIPMQQAFIMDNRQCLANLLDVAQGCRFQKHTAISHTLPKVFSIYVFHRNAGKRLFVEDVFNLYDVRMPAYS